MTDIKTKQWFILAVYVEVLSRHLDLLGYTDRGNPDEWDKEKGQLQQDGNWHNLDLSNIAPSSAVAVHLRIEFNNFVSSQVLMFRKKGNIHETNVAIGKTYAPMGNRQMELIVSCDENQIIQYKLSTGGDWTLANILVKGWYT